MVAHELVSLHEVTVAKFITEHRGSPKPVPREGWENYLAKLLQPKTDAEKQRAFTDDDIFDLKS